LKKFLLTPFLLFLSSASAFAGTSIPFTITMNEAVTVNTGGGTPRIAVNVGGVTRYASYSAGTGTSTLTFTYSAQAGDLDLDGVTLSSPLDLNGGTITDLNGNPETDLTFSVPNTSGIKVDYPSLSMDFTADADGQYTLSGTTYNSLSAFLTATSGTFTRNSIATYYDAAGVLQTASANQPRFDYAPVTHAAKGFLIEESRTNLTLNSDDIIIGPNWLNMFRSPVVTSNQTTAPDGTMTAEHMYCGTTDTQHSVGQFTNATDGLAYTFSAFVKTAGDDPTLARIQLQEHGNDYTVYGSTTITLTSDWQRVSVTATKGTDGNPLRSLFKIDGNAGSGLYIWGAQTEQGAFATSYIPTTSSAVTRQKDVTTIPILGWFNPAEGGAFAAWNKFANPNTVIFEFKNGSTSTSDRLNVFSGARKARLQIVPQGVTVIDSSGTYVPFVADNTVKAALAYKSGDSAVTADGVAPLTSSTSFSPISNYTELNLGRTNNGIYGNPISSGAVNGHLQSFKYYPARVANSQLQLLTQ